MSRDFLPAMYTQQEVKDAQLHFFNEYSSCRPEALQMLWVCFTCKTESPRLTLGINL